MKAIKDVTKQMPWKKSNGKLDLKKIDTLVVHHEAAFRPKTYNTMERIVGFALYHIRKGFGHYAYHYTIDNVGDIYRTVPENEVSYHAGNLAVNKRSLAVVMQGNMEVQAITPAQEKSLTDLCNYLFNQRPDMPLLLKKGLKMHKEVRLGATACPGRYLYPVVIKLRK
jgi:N-acetyl-anhydromuramyl-L-alanine amidase AmpD